MQADASKTSRLPVNPRRRKVAPEQRKRVARACNACNVRRVKCSGEQPCNHCHAGTRTCLYPAPVPSKEVILKNELDQLRQKCVTLEKAVQFAIPDDATREALLCRLESIDSTSQTLGATSLSESSHTDDAEATGGRFLSYPDGSLRFHGETSGASFLDLLKQFMLTLVPLTFSVGPGQTAANDGSTFVASLGQYQEVDSRPLLDLDVDPLWLPSSTEMIRMLAEFRLHLQDGNGSLPSGGILYWGDLYNPPTAITVLQPRLDAVKSNNYRHLAFYHAAFALASHVNRPKQGRTEEHIEDLFFKRALVLLGNPLDALRFTLRDVPVLALMGYYLLELNRRDSAYQYVSLAIHIAITHGAFRESVDEASKRVFWTLYIVDRWLSCLLGRPPSLMDEAIHLPLPADAPSLPSPVGLRAHVRLARISGFIVCNTFRVAPRETRPATMAHEINKALSMLSDWLEALPPTLQMPPEGFSQDPACCALHMSYNQLVLLTTRSIFFDAVKKAVAERYIQSGEWHLNQHPQYKLIQACSTAAHFNISLSQWTARLNNARRAMQADLHFVFNATVILLLNRILRAYAGAVDAEIDFAMDLFAKESAAGTNYQRDCHQVLTDLKVLIDRFLAPERPVSFQQNYVADHDDLNLSSTSNTYPKLLDGSGNRQHTFGEADELYRELMTWTQIDSQSEFIYRRLQCLALEGPLAVYAMQS